MSSSLRWVRALVRWLAPPADADAVLGDLEEARRIHTERHGRLAARVCTCIETLWMDPGLKLRTVLYAIVGLLACVGPARRALRIRPADALKVT